MTEKRYGKGDITPFGKVEAISVKNGVIIYKSDGFWYTAQDAAKVLKNETLPPPPIEKSDESIHSKEEFEPDSVVKSIMDEFITRAKKGKLKYNTDLDRTDLSVTDWIQHAIEEHMDSIVYLKKLKQILGGKTI